jgi:hypothetical protein
MFSKWVHSGGLPALPANIRLAYKWIEVATTVAYYDTTKITAVKSFIVQAQLWQKTETADKI